MKLTFVLDENVVILAHKLQDDRGQADETCLRLIREIERNCHRLAVSHSCYGRYGAQTRALQARGEPLRREVMQLLKALLASKEKESVYLSDEECVEVPGLDELPGVDLGDRDFVRAAASVPGSLLVSTDERLRSALSANAIDQKYGFSLASPAEALPLAQSGDA